MISKNFNISSQTIAAISTPEGKGGIGIIRISGKNAFKIINQIFLRKYKEKLFSEDQNRRLILGKIVLDGKEIVDEVMVCKMAAPNSYTREDTAEIHAHSGIANMEKILDIVISKGAKLAEPGEFSKRAFLNGRIDLIQAESIASIINAETEAQRVAASHLISGTFSRQISELLEIINKNIVNLETEIEFDLAVADQNTSKNSLVMDDILSIRATIDQMIKYGDYKKSQSPGIKICIAGEVNVGKSTLFNRLLGFDKAIVSPIKGTTRDVIEGTTKIGNFTVTFLDIAGFRKTHNSIEKAGIFKAREAAENSDVILYVFDRKIEKPIEAISQEICSTKKPIVVIINKIDLYDKANDLYFGQDEIPYTCVKISAKDGYGIETLTSEIKKISSKLRANSRKESFCNRRQFNILKNVKVFLDRAVESNTFNLPELIVNNLQGAKEELESLVGIKYDIDVLDQIFSRFCIGK